MIIQLLYFRIKTIPLMLVSWKSNLNEPKSHSFIVSSMVNVNLSPRSREILSMTYSFPGNVIHVHADGYVDNYPWCN